MQDVHQKRSPKRRRLDQQEQHKDEAAATMLPEKAPNLGALPAIKLNEVETRLKALLLDAARDADAAQNTAKSATQDADAASKHRNGVAGPGFETPTILRFTGGWVRDKLLGVDSKDVDVAINNMTGLQFGLRLQDYLRRHADKYGIGREEARLTTEGASAAGSFADEKNRLREVSLHKIEANPERSKHLETVTTKILGLDVDLVNLRTETYSEDSRNPQMSFGTAEEDALRRDATINALFYNLNTSSLEDFTRRGLSDLASQIIRTPLEPRQTFMDDPLRVLRLIRFASRFGFAIEEATRRAMDDDAIRSALLVKISRERVGTEVEKMLTGRTGSDALALVDQLHLYTTIFPAPSSAPNAVPCLDNWERAYGFTHRLMCASAQASHADAPSEAGPLPTIASVLLPDPRECYVAWLITALVPWAAAAPPPPASKQPKGKPPPPIPVSTAREGIKASNRVAAIISAAASNAEEIQSFQRRTLRARLSDARRPGARDGDAAVGRDTVGMALRSWGVSWRMQVLLALLLELVRADANDTTRVIDGYARFLTYLRDEDLLDVCSLKPLLDGNALQVALGAKPGRWIPPAIDFVLAWQLRNPGARDTDAIIRELKQRRDQLRI